MLPEFPSVEERVAEILVDSLDIRRALIERNTFLNDDLNIDSLDGIELIARLEEAFHLKIPLEELPCELDLTFGNLVEMLEKRLGVRNSYGGTYIVRPYERSDGSGYEMLDVSLRSISAARLLSRIPRNGPEYRAMYYDQDGGLISRVISGRTNINHTIGGFGTGHDVCKGTILSFADICGRYIKMVI